MSTLWLNKLQEHARLMVQQTLSISLQLIEFRQVSEMSRTVREHKGENYRFERHPAAFCKTSTFMFTIFCQGPKLNK